MEATVAYLLMLQKYIQSRKQYSSKQKTQKKKDYVLCLGNVSEDFTIENLKKKQD